MINLDLISLAVFVLILSIILYRNRKKAELQKIIFPAVYMVLFRSKFGLKFVDKFANKNRETLKFLGYCFIGISFFGLLFISYSIIQVMVKFFLAPAVTDTGMQLVLPGLNVPGIGYLSFWHWIISLFILVIVHEFSHAVMAKAHGINVKSSGFAVLSLLLPIFPAAFVEPDEKAMAKKDDAVQHSVFSAGPISNLILALIFGVLFFSVFTPIEQGMYTTEGVEIASVNTTGPAYASGIRNGTIITLVNYNKIDDASDFITTFEYCVPPDQVVFLSNSEQSFGVSPIMRKGSDDDKAKPYIGVNLRSNSKLKPGAEKYIGVFSWFKGLCMWLFLLNFFIGLANLLPIFVTDGAQMLKLMLSRVVSDKKKAVKVWMAVNSLFLALLVIGLLATYIKQILGL